jgi:hypothetical protein
VASLKQAGLHILVYTVNKPQRAAELLRWGVDCICTDAIDVIGPNFTFDGFAAADLYGLVCRSIPPLLFGSTCCGGLRLPPWPRAADSSAAGFADAAAASGSDCSDPASACLLLLLLHLHLILHALLAGTT